MFGQPLTEQQKLELNGHVETLPIIEKLKDNDEKLLQGQQDIEQRLDKGAKRMDGIEGELKEVKTAVEALKDMMVSQHADLKNTILNNEVQRLSKELDKRETQIKDHASKAWDIKKIIITAIVGIIALGVGVGLNLK